MPDLLRKFKEHPAEVGMSYREHLIFAVKLSQQNFKAAFASLIHAFLPFIFKTTTSRIVYKQYEILKDRITLDSSEETYNSVKK